MKYRKLRIAWSVGWGITCVLLVVLCVLSVWLSFVVGGSVSAGRQLYLSSSLGEIGFSSLTPVASIPVPTVQPIDVHVDRIDAASAEYIKASRKMGRAFAGVRWEDIGNGWGISTILLWPVLISAAFVAAPWIPRRFSLRALLIAMTVIAAILGLVIWAAK